MKTKMIDQCERCGEPIKPVHVDPESFVLCSRCMRIDQHCEKMGWETVIDRCKTKRDADKNKELG